MDNQKSLVFQKLSGIHRNKNFNCSHVIVLVVEFLVGFFKIFLNVFEASDLMVLVSTVKIAPAIHQV